MVGTTRRRTRNTAVETPTSSGDEKVSQHAPAESRYNTPIATHLRSPEDEPDDVSRLSEEFEPMDLHNENSQQDEGIHVDDDSHTLGAHMKECIATINRLEGLGLSKLDIPLPKCIVLGEQSTGKSSVIEGLSGITTPRADDICTRCPIFINLAPSNANDPHRAWIARVTLRRSFAYDGSNAEDRQFRGWFPTRETEEIPFATARSREQLTHIISRAQSATVNPGEDPSIFLQPTLPIEDRFAQTDLSPNIVCIYISAPDLPNLSFYDLPGIINQADTEEKKYLIEFVRALVTKYIENEDSLILVTCALDTDIANSSAAALARKLKAEDRCIGILTKPDRIDKTGPHEKLRGVLEGTRFALGHGYFVVKNLSQVEIDAGMKYRDARDQERSFFHEKPWSTSFRDHQHRFGTPKLQSFLSRKLAANVSSKLPIIHNEIDARLQAVEMQLSHLPKPPHSAVRTIADILHAFSEDVRKQMEGGPGYTTWTNIWEKVRQQFEDDLEEMKPGMIRIGAQDKGVSKDWLPGSSQNPVSVDSGDEDGDDEAIEAPRTPAKKRKLDGTPASTPSKTPNTARKFGPRPSNNQQLPTPGQTTVPSSFKDLRTRFHLDELAARVEQESKSSFGTLRPEVLDEITMSTLKNWQLPTTKFFAEFEKALKKEMKLIFHEYFQKWESAALYHRAWNLVEGMLNIHIQQQRDTMALESLTDELDKPYPYPKDSYERERANMLTYYTTARYESRLKIFEKEVAEHLERPLTPKELEKAKKDTELQKTLHKDPYEKEVDLVAKVTAYYVFALRRFHVKVCHRIQSKLFRALKNELRNEIDSGLGIHDDEKGTDNARSLLEDSHREKRRQDLLRDQRNLLAGQKILNELQQKYGDAAPQQQRPDYGHRYGSTFTPSESTLEDVFMANSRQ